MNALAPTILHIASPILSELQEQVKLARRNYNKATLLVAECWQAFDEAIESNESVEDRNLLVGYAKLAEDMKHDAWVDMNNAEALLLSQWN